MADDPAKVIVVKETPVAGGALIERRYAADTWEATDDGRLYVKRGAWAIATYAPGAWLAVADETETTP
jgi:hypothetical protein